MSFLERRNASVGLGAVGLASERVIANYPSRSPPFYSHRTLWYMVNISSTARILGVCSHLTVFPLIPGWGSSSRGDSNASESSWTGEVGESVVSDSIVVTVAVEGFTGTFGDSQERYMVGVLWFGWPVHDARGGGCKTRSTAHTHISN